jgi:hypothetical protein
MLSRAVRFSRMCLLVGACLLAFFLVVTPEAFAQAAGAAVNGQIKGLRGEPKQFVSVSLEGPGRYVAITNAEGVFTIQNVTPGRYTVRVRQGDLVAVFTRDVDTGRIDLDVNW